MPTAVVALREIVEQSALRGEGGARSASDEDDVGAVIVVVYKNGLVPPRLLLVPLPVRVCLAVAAGPTDGRRHIRYRLQSKPRRGLLLVAAMTLQAAGKTMR